MLILKFKKNNQQQSSFVASCDQYTSSTREDGAVCVRVYNSHNEENFIDLTISSQKSLCINEYSECYVMSQNGKTIDVIKPSKPRVKAIDTSGIMK